MFETALYDYDLPGHLIARHPPVRRDDSRMLVLHRSGQRIEHANFRDLPSFLSPSDLLVLNDSRVIRARLRPQDFRGELLLLESESPVRWLCLARPGRRWRAGAVVRIAAQEVRVVEVQAGGERIVEFAEPPLLEIHGEMPLPPYLRREAGAEDADRYQTVYAREEGSVAAPTAGLHFTPELLAALPHVCVTLHVGAGTFKPVESEDLRDHPMHGERFVLSAAAADRINRAQRVVAVGTTSVRMLESCADADGIVTPGSGRTSIFIHPPYTFRRTNALLTNFHLPRSTLLMLVSAFAGREWVLEAYAEAVRSGYRFYSYGDCMLVL